MAADWVSACWIWTSLPAPHPTIRRSNNLNSPVEPQPHATTSGAVPSARMRSPTPATASYQPCSNAVRSCTSNRQPLLWCAFESWACIPSIP